MKQFINCNSNLITIKCVLFLFFGALGALLPFIPQHMTDRGISRDEAIIIFAISPLLAIIGPLVAAPLADKLAGGLKGSPRSKTGRYLTVMISVCCILAALFYGLLYTIPRIRRGDLNVTFTCDEKGGYVLQDRCETEAEHTCYNWGYSQRGSLLVKNCIFDCNATTSYRQEVSTPSPIEDTSSAGDYDYDSIGSGNEPENVLENNRGDNNTITPKYPHMCFKNSNGATICEVYTEHSVPIEFELGLKPSLNDHKLLKYNETDPLDIEGMDNDTCKYPIGEYFSCRIPFQIEGELRKKGNENCHPMVVCEIHDPYNNTDSLLKRSRCGYDNISFWLYLTLKSMADIFVAAAVTLLATAVVIATRETSTGRGDIGKQFAMGALGFGVFALIIGGAAYGDYLSATITFAVLMIVAVAILLIDQKMPLSPPEWWWHTRCGLLALPMSSVRKYGLETAALGIILLLLGIFWNAIDTFIPEHLVKLANSDGPLDIGIMIGVSALPATIFLFFAEIIVDYCGHSNILIFCFVNYICHNLALVFHDGSTVPILIGEVLEIFTLHIMYVTAILYLRHLVPRKISACGQALPVIAHFCLGRCFGALIGAIGYSGRVADFVHLHAALAVAAAIVAVIYYVVYHFYLKPKCAAPMHLPPDPAPAFIQGMNNGNGSYTPLRVYHNSKSKKGHFRY